MDVQVGQLVTNVGFLVLTNHPTEVILGPAFIDENIIKTYPKWGIIVPKGSQPIVISDDELERKSALAVQGEREDSSGNLDEQCCITIRWKRIPPMKESFVEVRTNA